MNLAHLSCKIVLVIGSGAMLLACSSSSVLNDKKTNPEFSICGNKEMSRKFIWTIAFYQGLPKGMEINKVPEFVKDRGAHQATVIKSFLKGIISLSLNSKSEIEAIKSDGDFLSEERTASLIETGPNNFVSCYGDNCENINDPITKVTIKSFSPRYRQRKMYYAVGVIDPEDSMFNDHKMSGSSYPSPAFIFWPEYFKRHTFLAGDFIAQHYFSFTDAQKPQLCQSAGLNTNCFGEPIESDISDYCKDPSFERKFPFVDHFMSTFNIDGDNDICRNNPSFYQAYHARKEFLKAYKNDGGYAKLLWDSAWGIDLLFMSTVRVSTNAIPNWTIIRGEWDTNPFCKYAKPKTDLVTH